MKTLIDTTILLFTCTPEATLLGLSRQLMDVFELLAPPQIFALANRFISVPSQPRAAFRVLKFKMFSKVENIIMTVICLEIAKYGPTKNNIATDISVFSKNRSTF